MQNLIIQTHYNRFLDSYIIYILRNNNIIEKYDVKYYYHLPGTFNNILYKLYDSKIRINITTIYDSYSEFMLIDEFMKFNPRITLKKKILILTSTKYNISLTTKNSSFFFTYLKPKT
uniref:hypothetical protein n=1 Tax=Polyozellus multiplex TaxID=281719 RepID=UPI001F12ED07|nr:hypothetical protein MN596_mgp05 [Polyozellus multiplex]UMI33318.1 hypothetical protein [Polyozellus multiplex]